MLITTDHDIRGLLGRTSRIAIIGLSSNPERPSYRVARAMQAYGFTIAPVNPNETEVLGEVAYSSLAEVPGAVDLVNVFRQPDYVSEIVLACIDKPVNALWLQEGVINRPATERAVEAGLDIVVDRCIYKEYRRLMV